MLSRPEYERILPVPVFGFSGLRGPTSSLDIDLLVLNEILRHSGNESATINQVLHGMRKHFSVTLESGASFGLRQTHVGNDSWNLLQEGYSERSQGPLAFMLERGLERAGAPTSKLYFDPIDQRHAEQNREDHEYSGDPGIHRGEKWSRRQAETPHQANAVAYSFCRAVGGYDWQHMLLDCEDGLALKLMTPYIHFNFRQPFAESNPPRDIWRYEGFMSSEHMPHGTLTEVLAIALHDINKPNRVRANNLLQYLEQLRRRQEQQL